MKSHFVFFIKVVTTFIASFIVPLWVVKPDNDIGSDLDKTKSLIGKKAIVVDCVTSDAGKVKLAGSNWEARLCKECSATSLVSGNEVTIKKSEQRILYVY